MKASRFSALTNRELGQYAALLGALVALALAAVALNSHSINWLSALALVPAFCWYLGFTMTQSASIAMRRFGNLTVHAVTFAIVVGGYWFYAAALAAVGPWHDVKDSWSGVLTAMTSVWGVALLAHLTVVALTAKKSRGYEDVSIH